MEATRMSRHRVQFVLDPDRIYELRMMQGLTQEEVAKKAGRTKASISLYESGQRLTPNPDTTRKLAKALGVGVPDILIRKEVDKT